jgi:hypothetical protein
MSLLLLEALGALALLLLIVWWTMFSGRKNGEVQPAPTSHDEAATQSSVGHIAKHIEQIDRPVD